MPVANTLRWQDPGIVPGPGSLDMHTHLDSGIPCLQHRQASNLPSHRASESHVLVTSIGSLDLAMAVRGGQESVDREQKSTGWSGGREQKPPSLPVPITALHAQLL